MNKTKRYPPELLNLPVHTNMKGDPPTVSPEDSVSTVVDLMTSEDVGAVIVVEDRQPVGIMTEKDLLERVIKSAKHTELSLVRDVMSKPAVTIDAEKSVGDGLTIMDKNNIRRLIVTKNGSLLGLTTERRLLEIVCAQYVQDSYGAVRGVLYDYASRIGVAYVSTYPPRECGIAT